MDSILKLTWKEMRAKFLDLSLTPSEVVKTYFKQIKQTYYLNTFITLCEESALKQASIADAKYKEGTARSLEGYPVAIKDLFCTKEVLTTAASKMLDNFIPNYESSVTQYLWDDGAIMLGKTNMDEFAMGAANLYSAFGPAINPNKASHGNVCVAGGSSGGSSACISGFQSLGALGSDTGGSVRQPAAFCGVVGIRPTYGTCSRYGMIAFASSLDQAGVFARDVHTAACCLESIMKADKKDATHACKPVPKLSELKGELKGLRVGIVKADHVVQNDAVRKMMVQAEKKLIEVGCNVEHVEIKSFDYAIPAYYVFTPAEAASNLSRYDGIRYGRKSKKGDTYHEKCMNARANFGDEVKRRLLLGNYLLSSEHYDRYYGQATKVRQWMIDEMNGVFEDFDILISPTSPHAAFPIDRKLSPEQMYFEDYFTAPINLTGHCALSIPFGVDSDNMPLGLQVIAPAFREDLLINAGLGIEKLSDFQASEELVSEEMVQNIIKKT